jgi:hypothetical protein
MSFQPAQTTLSTIALIATLVAICLVIAGILQRLIRYLDTRLDPAVVAERERRAEKSRERKALKKLGVHFNPRSRI